jgi:hypothetical protein
MLYLLALHQASTQWVVQHVDVLVDTLRVEKPCRHTKSHASAAQVMLTFWQSHTYLRYPTNRNQVTLNQGILVHSVFCLHSTIPKILGPLDPCKQEQQSVLKC